MGPPVHPDTKSALDVVRGVSSCPDLARTVSTSSVQSLKISEIGDVNETGISTRLRDPMGLTVKNGDLIVTDNHSVHRITEVEGAFPSPLKVSRCFTRTVMHMSCVYLLLALVSRICDLSKLAVDDR